MIAEAFLAGAKRAGADTQNVFLIEKDIHHCTGCFSCWFKTPGKCIFQDDMTALLERYKSSDLVCFATPVYLWNMTACLKNFLDRLIPTKNPNVVQGQDGFDMETNLHKMPDVVAIANSGFPGGQNFDIMHAVMRPANPVLEIYRNNGMLLRMERAEVKPVVQAYLDFVKEAGFLLASGQLPTEAVVEGLNAPMLSDEAYLRIISGG